MRRTAMLSLVLTACTGQLSSTGDPSAADGGRSPSIVNGAPTSGFPSVVELLGSDGQGSWRCTATVISDHALLTAAHCVQGAASIEARSELAIFSGASGTTTIASATSWPSHPGWAGTPGVHDVAVVLFAKHKIIVSPSQLHAATPLQGQQLVLVGYGVTGFSGKDSGVKRVGKNSIAQVLASTFTFNSTGLEGNVCFGDSGGPSLFVSGALVGVHSATQGQQCAIGIDMRVDQYVSWIQGQAPGAKVFGATPPPTADAGVPPADLGAPPPSGGGCLAGAAGCGGCSCQACVCGQDPFCCTTAWDALCVSECTSCGGCPATPHLDAGLPPPKADSGQPKADAGLPPPKADAGGGGAGCQTGPAGCADCACKACVCAQDSYCCSGQWDWICVNECKACGGCGGPSTVVLACWKGIFSGERWCDATGFPQPGYAAIPNKKWQIAGWPAPGTKPLYSCLSPGGADQMVSFDCAAEGYDSLGLIGHLWTSPGAGRVPLYRCNASGDHFVGNATCNQEVVDNGGSPIGYALPFP